MEYFLVRITRFFMDNSFSRKIFLVDRSPGLFNRLQRIYVCNAFWGITTRVFPGNVDCGSISSYMSTVDDFML